MKLALSDILAERMKQDQQWGGPSHDDTHSTDDWMKYILYQIDRSRYEPITEERRYRLVKIAALALAACESIDRTVGGI